MKKIRSTKGITLISLVITIIILLILSGVSIDILTGENGLLETTRNAKIQTEKARIKEDIQTDILGKQAENQGNISESTLKEILEKYGVLSKEGEKITDKTLKTTEGEYEIKVSDIFDGTIKNPEIADESGANPPNLNKIAQKTYVTWDLNKATTEYETTEYKINDKRATQPDYWYDYGNGKWANIKTTNKTSDTETLEAYWVWIPRFAYKLPESSIAKKIEVIFVKGNGKTGANGETCYYATDSGITTDNSGLYVKKTTDAQDKWIIHPAFTDKGNGGFGELDGIWVAKFEAVSNNPTATDGGGNSPSLKVQAIPNRPSWRGMVSKNIFSACRKMTDKGEVLEGSKVDSHMMKNTEWGAVAILSQSKYGVYNPESLNGEKGDDKEYQIWNNPSSLYITGSVGPNKDATDTTTSAYNSANGPKASTTGTVYGVYDMAGGSWEYVAGCLEGKENQEFGVKEVDTKYVDLYENSSDSIEDYNGAKTGDATKETKGWNNDFSDFVYVSCPMFRRGRILRLWHA